MFFDKNFMIWLLSYVEYVNCVLEQSDLYFTVSVFDIVHTLEQKTRFIHYRYCIRLFNLTKRLEWDKNYFMKRKLRLNSLQRSKTGQIHQYCLTSIAYKQLQNVLRNIMNSYNFLTICIFFHSFIKISFTSVERLLSRR